MNLEQVCPSCLSLDLVHEPGAWTCQQCGMVFDPPLVLCPSCGGANVADDDACAACGRPLTLVDQVLNRHSNPRTPTFLASVRDQAPALKESEQRSSEARSQEFLEIDRRREEQQAIQEAQRRRSDRMLLSLGIALGAIVLGAACIVGLVIAG
ncbi:MAG: hypothetical protein MUO23_02260 [Anaerolineales bacterium]|nr:hypothetical protein [Anaerolineales bacterium]